ncbi:hypothetical protein SAMN02800692_2047 [Luteibacter sp. UNC138MFCol5.1]|nr:hypothetical protein SAMN02800692_2047 [Luteibacter sp. UNC138MFCol5.1]
MTNATSILKRVLLGRQLSAVAFVMDYFQFQFDGATLTSYSKPRPVIYEHDPGHFRDQLCAFIGAVVTDALEVDGQNITLTFGDVGTLSIPLDDESRQQVEAAELHDEGRALAIW